MPINCTINAATGCIDCPAIDMVPTVPAYIISTPVAGWDTGANSVRWRGGDMHVFDFGVAISGAAVVGFKPRRTYQLVPELIEHGLLFQLVGGLRYVRVVELGEMKTMLTPYDETDVFEIRRIGTTVSYFKNARRLYTSDKPSYGSRVVNACLYVSGDTVI